jgi:glycosyltransferase involved in cell wall biosynthesis
MKISVVTVCHNSASTIEETLLSVAEQRYQDVEHIVIDGASTDGTLDVIHKHHDKIAVMRSEPDCGIYEAMNKGIARATGDVIGFLNADDVYADTGVLADIAGVFTDVGIDACYANLVYVAKEDTSQIVRFWKSEPFRNGMFEKGWVPPHPTFYARRAVYQRLGGFNLKYKLAADFELMARFLGRHHIRVSYLPRITVRMRLGGATNRSMMNIIRQNIEIWQAARANGTPLFVPLFLARKILSRISQFRSASQV